MDQDLRTVLRAINTGVIDIRTVIENLKPHLSDAALLDLFSEVTDEIATRDAKALGQGEDLVPGEAPVWLGQISRNVANYYGAEPLFQEVALSPLRAYQNIRNFLLLLHGDYVLEIADDQASVTVRSAFHRVLKEIQETIISPGGLPARLELMVLERTFETLMASQRGFDFTITVSKLEMDPNFGKLLN